jgi:hypothetical protein
LKYTQDTALTWVRNTPESRPDSKELVLAICPSYLLDLDMRYRLVPANLLEYLPKVEWWARIPEPEDT